MDTQEQRIQQLAVCLGEHLMISGCTQLQGILACLTALTHSCNNFPGGSEVIKELLAKMLYPTPQSPPSEAQGYDPAD